MHEFHDKSSEFLARRCPGVEKTNGFEIKIFVFFVFLWFLGFHVEN